MMVDPAPGPWPDWSEDCSWLRELEGVSLAIAPVVVAMACHVELTPTMRN